MIHINAWKHCQDQVIRLKLYSDSCQEYSWTSDNTFERLSLSLKCCFESLMGLTYVRLWSSKVLTDLGVNVDMLNEVSELIPVNTLNASVKFVIECKLFTSHLCAFICILTDIKRLWELHCCPSTIWPNSQFFAKLWKRTSNDAQDRRLPQGPNYKVTHQTLLELLTIPLPAAFGLVTFLEGHKLRLVTNVSITT